MPVGRPRAAPPRIAFPLAGAASRLSRIQVDSKSNADSNRPHSALSCGAVRARRHVSPAYLAEPFTMSSWFAGRNQGGRLRTYRMNGSRETCSALSASIDWRKNSCPGIRGWNLHGRKHRGTAASSPRSNKALRKGPNDAYFFIKPRRSGRSSGECLFSALRATGASACTARSVSGSSRQSEIGRHEE